MCEVVKMWRCEDVSPCKGHLESVKPSSCHFKKFTVGISWEDLNLCFEILLWNWPSYKIVWQLDVLKIWQFDLRQHYYLPPRIEIFSSWFSLYIKPQTFYEHLWLISFHSNTIVQPHRYFWYSDTNFPPMSSVWSTTVYVKRQVYISRRLREKGLN